MALVTKKQNTSLLIFVMKSILELETGEKFEGNNFGHISKSSGEIVFQTGITGYPETITDPSYAGQFIVFTTPLINNYGFPKDSINPQVPNQVQKLENIISRVADIPSSRPVPLQVLVNPC